jgi:hypothetical protein
VGASPPGADHPREFRVIPHRELFGQVSARIAFFDRRGIAPIGYDGLREAVRSARAKNDLR